MPAAPAPGVTRQHDPQPMARQRPKSPNRILAEAEEQWLFTEADLLKTPSLQDGMPVEKEREARAKGLNFIRQVGIMLKLPELTLSTAAIFFNRFLMRMSLVDRPGAKALHHYIIAGTCLFLATKVEESCRKLKDFIEACCRVAQKTDKQFDEQSKDYWRWRDTILQNEDVLLETLCFDLTIDAPHKQLFSMLKFYGVEKNKPLRNAAWAFITDSNMTSLCLISSSRTIAAAALYAGARICDVRLKDTRGRPWWEEQGVTLREMIKTTNFMCQSYENPPQKGDGPMGSGEGGPSGGNSIYVGLFTDLSSIPDDSHPAIDSLPASSGYATASEGATKNGAADGAHQDELPWERTRLKAAQGIASPAGAGALGADDNGTSDGVGNSSRRASATSQSSVKRPRAESHVNGDDSRSKRRKVSPTAQAATSAPGGQVSGNHAEALPVKQNGTTMGVSPAEGNGSEEGEVEE